MIRNAPHHKVVEVKTWSRADHAPYRSYGDPATIHADILAIATPTGIIYRDPTTRQDINPRP